MALATLALEAAYEATLCAAIVNYDRTGNNRLYLTQLGGGAFGNEQDWIIDSMRRALKLHSGSGLDVAIVSFRASDRAIRELISEFK